MMMLLYCALCYVVCRPIMIIICVIAFGICVLSFSLFWFVVASLSESHSLSNFRWRFCSLSLARLLLLSFSFYRLPCWWPYTIGLVWCTQTLEFTQINPKEISRTNSIYSFENFLLFVRTMIERKTSNDKEKHTEKCGTSYSKRQLFLSRTCRNTLNKVNTLNGPISRCIYIVFN